MAHIVEVSGERRLQLSGEELTRPMAWGSSWTKLRIGITVGINAIQTWGSGSYYGGVGICQGPNGFNSLNTIAYYGLLVNRGWTWVPAAGPYFSSDDGNGWRTTKIGSTISSTGLSQNVHYLAWAPKNLAQFFWEYTKTGTSYSSIIRFTGTAHIALPVSRYDFLRNMENENGTLWNATSVGSLSSSTIGDAYALDTVSLFHSLSIPTMEIANLEVIRFE